MPTPTLNLTHHPHQQCPPPPEPPPPDSLISPAKSLTYWRSIPPTISGMLGGYPQISRTDLQHSQTFLAKLRRLHPLPPLPSSSSPKNTPSVKSPPTTKDKSAESHPKVAELPMLRRGVDCGAGIGRVTVGFLSKVCEVVDIVEPVQAFADETRRARCQGAGKVGEVYVCGLETWSPSSSSSQTYDLVWIQWCLGHLTDAGVVALLVRVGKVVAEAGWVVVKENVVREGPDLWDEGDGSVMRGVGSWRELFARAGFGIVREEVVKGFPGKLGLFPVWVWGLRVKSGGERVDG